MDANRGDQESEPVRAEYGGVSHDEEVGEGARETESAPLGCVAKREPREESGEIKGPGRLVHRHPS